MFPSKKEVEMLRKELTALSEAHNRLVNTVVRQQEEINELKKPKEPEYFG